MTVLIYHKADPQARGRRGQYEYCIYNGEKLIKRSSYYGSKAQAVKAAKKYLGAK